MVANLSTECAFLKRKPAQWKKSPMVEAEKNSLLMISFYPDGLALLCVPGLVNPVGLRKFELSTCLL